MLSVLRAAFEIWFLETLKINMWSIISETEDGQKELATTHVQNKDNNTKSLGTEMQGLQIMTLRTSQFLGYWAGFMAEAYGDTSARQRHLMKNPE
jgi:hypothetical protein